MRNQQTLNANNGINYTRNLELKNMNDLTVFEFGANPVKTIVDDNNETWFLAKNIAEILGYKDTEAMTRRLDDDEVQNLQIVGFGNRGVNFINESGLYAAILGSKKPIAKRFKKWVTSEVLPSIRKTGAYHVNQESSCDDYKQKCKELFDEVAVNSRTECYAWYPSKKIIEDVKAVFEGSLDIAVLLGFEGESVIYFADDCVCGLIGFSPVEIGGVRLLPKKQPERLLCPKEIGMKLDKYMGAMQVNKILEAQGFQIKNPMTNRWMPTDKGRQFAVAVGLEREDWYGHIQNFRWKESIVDEIHFVEQLPLKFA
jgi:prophage antirepressor-like protein